MTERALQDAAAREAIRTVLDRNFLVEAGAGSGKTTSLVERMAALILSGTCPVEEIAAVTFTRKAAGELRERFQLYLEKARREAADPGAARRAAAALGRLDRAFVGTIHSFCARLLRERPVEAGITPDFTEIEGMEERLLEERAWEEYLLEVRLRRPGLLEMLDRLDVSPAELKDTYRQLTLYPDVTAAVADTPYPDLDPVRQALAKLCRLAEPHLPPEPHPRRGWDALQQLLRQALRWQRYFDLADDRYLLRLLERFKKSIGPTLYCWPDREAAREIRDAYHHFRETHAEPALRQWQEYRHKPLMEFLIPAAEHCRAMRRRENSLNFQDLLMCAAALLRDNPEVRAYFQQRYSRLLVDEFQDTDPIQAEVMLYLAGDDCSRRDWTGLKPRPGALFVVGDPKQSIYRFRRADIDIYNRVKKQILAAGGEVLYLTTNFRSLPPLLEWTNDTFKTLFAAAPPYQASFVPMDRRRAAVPGTAGGLLKNVLAEGAAEPEEIAEEDARRIAAWIARALEGNLSLSRASGEATPAAAGDFMILVRFKKDMVLYARALENRGIPFSLSGGGDISGSEELRELLYLLQALADPGNPVALAAVLRGDLFGLSDDQLYRFRQAGGRFSFLEEVPEGTDPALATIFRGIWEKLRRFRRWSRELPPSAALEKIIAGLGLLPLALAGGMGRGRAGYIFQVLDLVRRREQEGQADFSDTVDFLAGLLESGLEDELDLEGGRAAGVRIMNLHKAKGLEAPVVILANPGRNPAHEPEAHIRRGGDSAAGYFPLRRRKNWRVETLALPPDWDRCAAEENLYREAEEIRLLYVAATRARDLLVMSSCPAKSQSSPWFPLEPFLEQAPVLELEHPAAGPPARVAAGEPVTPRLFAAAGKEIRAGLERLAEPSYGRAVLSAAAGAKGVPPPPAAAGRGASWGNVIHAGLEALARAGEAADLEAIAAAMLRREGRPLEERDSVAALLRRIAAGPFWRRVAAAGERYTEVPLGLWEENRYLSGVIDLVFKEDGGWVVVDYKSDAIRDEDHFAALIDYYRSQVEEYARRWAGLAGESVRECGLFFTDCLQYVKLEGNSRDTILNS